MKIVLDANVLFAAIGARVVAKLSSNFAWESTRLLRAHRFSKKSVRSSRRKIKLPKETVEELIGFLERHTTSVQPAKGPTDACRDPDDLMVLGTATAANASFIVTGDRDLLTLESYQGIPIVTPRRFWSAQSEAPT